MQARVQKVVAGGQSGCGWLTSGVLHKWLWHSDIDKTVRKESPGSFCVKPWQSTISVARQKSGYVPCCSVYGFVETADRRVVEVLRNIAPVPKTCQNGHRPIKFYPSVPKKPLFGHGISGIEDIAADQPEARQVFVARVTVVAR